MQVCRLKVSTLSSLSSSASCAKLGLYTPASFSSLSSSCRLLLLRGPTFQRHSLASLPLIARGFAAGRADEGEVPAHMQNFDDVVSRIRSEGRLKKPPADAATKALSAAREYAKQKKAKEAAAASNVTAAASPNLSTQLKLARDKALKGDIATAMLNIQSIAAQIKKTPESDLTQEQKTLLASTYSTQGSILALGTKDDKARAVQMYKDALALDPNNKEALEGTKRLTKS